jgi:pimeloyl-ACP methyl ester carboxylesterase
VSAAIEQSITLSHHLSLTAQIWGEPDAPPLLALHGWLDNAGSYAFLAPLLAAHWRVIALELPGHGHSGHLPAGINYHYMDYVSAVTTAADALQLKRYSLLGHSLGAGIASLVAAAKPQAIERLYLIEGLGPLGDDGSHTLQRFRDAFAVANASGKSLRVFRDSEQAIQARTLASGLRAESQIRALLAGIESPTALLLSNPPTPYLPTAMMQERASLLSRIKIAHMDGGHHLHLEHAQGVAQWIQAHS